MRGCAFSAVLALAGPATSAQSPAPLLAQAPAPSAAGLEPAAVPMEVRKVSEHVHYVLGQAGIVSTANQGFNSNAGFVVTRDGVVVFDVLGTPALGQRFAELIARTTQQPVRRIVISHYHADHFYGLQAFVGAGAGGPQVWADTLVREYLAGDAPAARLAERRQSLAPWVNERTRIVAPHRYLAEDAAFKLGGLTFRVLRVGPAHTPEDLMLLVEEDDAKDSGVLFVGDLMFAGRIPFVGDADVSSWVKAIDRVLAFKPRIVVGGHGPASANADVELRATRDYLAYLRAQMAAAFEAGLDFEEAYERTDWSAYAALPAFAAANRRNAYQTYLNVEREALAVRK